MKNGINSEQKENKRRRNDEANLAAGYHVLSTRFSLQTFLEVPDPSDFIRDVHTYLCSIKYFVRPLFAFRGRDFRDFLRDIFANIFVARTRQLVRVTVKNDLALP